MVTLAQAVTLCSRLLEPCVFPGLGKMARDKAEGLVLPVACESHVSRPHHEHGGRPGAPGMGVRHL